MLLLALQATYQSELIKETSVYPRVCGKGNYHYEAIQIEIQHSGSYTFNANSTIKLYGYIYRGDFDPSYPNTDIITQSNFSCGSSFKVGNYLEANKVWGMCRFPKKEISEISKITIINNISDIYNRSKYNYRILKIQTISHTFYSLDTTV